MKMDAVPGIPTTLWFTPKYTTAKMKEITGNKDFVYEIACDQMCGSGHYSMKGLIIVETQEEYNSWIATQKPQYLTVKAATTESTPKVVSDTLKTTAVITPVQPIAQNTQH
jgi:cytochrome c oxidase subunit 2